MNPQIQISNWLPHILLLLLLLCAVWLLCSVLAPLSDPLLLAMAVAAMTYPVIYKPVEVLSTRLFPNVNPTLRRQSCGPIAALLLVCIAISPFLLIIFTTIPSISEALWILVNVPRQDPEAIDRLATVISSQAEAIHQLYPKLPINAEAVHQEAVIVLTNDFNVDIMNFLSQGSSRLAELVLSLVALAFFYAHGPRLLHVFLDYTPLTPDQQDEMTKHHFQVIVRLLHDTIGTAVVKGFIMGLIIWGLTGNSFLLVAILSAFLSLLPIIGLTMVWLPLAALSWSHGDYITAVLIAIISLIANYGIDWVRNHYGRRIHDRDAWTSFLLFLGLVGGIIVYGLKGFVVGPMVVVITSVLGRFWLPLYGFHTDTARFEHTHKTHVD